MNKNAYSRTITHTRNCMYLNTWIFTCIHIHIQINTRKFLERDNFCNIATNHKYCTQPLENTTDYIYIYINGAGIMKCFIANNRVLLQTHKFSLSQHIRYMQTHVCKRINTHKHTHGQTHTTHTHIPFCGLLHAVPNVLQTLIHSSNPSAVLDVALPATLPLLLADAPSVLTMGSTYSLKNKQCKSDAKWKVQTWKTTQNTPDHSYPEEIQLVTFSDHFG